MRRTPQANPPQSPSQAEAGPRPTTPSIGSAEDTRPSSANSAPPVHVSVRESIDALVPFPGNPRRGSVAEIAAALEQHGQLRPAVVNLRTRYVLIGNHMLRAARTLGWRELDVIWVDLDEHQARRLLLLDNRLSDKADYDVNELLAMLESFEDLDGTGYEQADLDELLESLDPPPLVEDDVPPPPAEPVTKPGELIELGQHTLLCGDARDPEALARLLDGEPAEVLWTDPPYGVDYEGKTSRKLRIANDSSGGLASLLRDAFGAVDGVLTAGSPIYVAHPAGPLMTFFLTAFGEAGWSLRQTLVWVKDAMVLGRSDYHYRHEPILYGYKPVLAGRLGRGGTGWYGDNRQTSVFEIDRPRSSRDHPTMKPPELIESMLRNSSRRAGIVLDPFAGSGSTLIAAERTGRRARVLEIDPRYCDVVVARYEALTSKPAVRRAA